jgi:hypothetical protein
MGAQCRLWEKVNPPGGCARDGSTPRDASDGSKPTEAGDGSKPTEASDGSKSKRNQQCVLAPSINLEYWDALTALAAYALRIVLHWLHATRTCQGLLVSAH